MLSISGLRVTVYLSSLFLFAGCIHTRAQRSVILVDGVKVRDVYWDRAKADLRRRFELDVGCPVQPEFRLIESDHRGRPTSVYAVGCRQRVNYTRSRGPWMLSATTMVPQHTK